MSGGRSQAELVVFLCNWACYTPAELAEVERALGGGDRLVRLPCAGRLSPELLLSAVQAGCGAVLVVGCGPGSCHYREGSRLAHERLELLRQFLLYLGLEPRRVQLHWQGAAGGLPFGELVERARAGRELEQS